MLSTIQASSEKTPYHSLKMPVPENLPGIIDECAKDLRLSVPGLVLRSCKHILNIQKILVANGHDSLYWFVRDDDESVDSSMRKMGGPFLLTGAGHQTEPIAENEASPLTTMTIRFTLNTDNRILNSIFAGMTKSLFWEDQMKKKVHKLNAPIFQESKALFESNFELVDYFHDLMNEGFDAFMMNPPEFSSFAVSNYLTIVSRYKKGDVIVQLDDSGNPVTQFTF